MATPLLVAIREPILSDVIHYHYHTAKQTQAVLDVLMHSFTYPRMGAHVLNVANMSPAI